MDSNNIYNNLIDEDEYTEEKKEYINEKNTGYNLLYDKKVIVDENNIVVCKQKEYIFKFGSNEASKIYKYIGNEKIKDVSYILEGSTVYVWFSKNNEKWMISTPSKIDAYQSFYGDYKNSVADYFLNILNKIVNKYDPLNKVNSFELFTSKLNIDYTYCFTIPSTFENKFVYEFPEKIIIGNKKINNKTGNEWEKITENIDILNLVCKERDLNVLIKFADTCFTPDNKKFIGVEITLSNKTFQIINNNYYKLSKIRGKKEITSRYFEIRNDFYFLKILKEIVPECVAQFNDFERLIDLIIVPRIYKAYIARYKEYKYVIIPHYEFQHLSSIVYDLNNIEDENELKKFIKNSFNYIHPWKLEKIVKNCLNFT
jgi:hypothetical protein